MRLTSLALVSALTLAACEVTPLEQCKAQARAALRQNAEQIEIAERNIARGYQYVQSDVRFGLKFCANPSGTFSICTGTGDEPTYRRIPVNIEAERAKLAVLLDERARLEQAYAQCAINYPAAPGA